MNRMKQIVLATGAAALAWTPAAANHSWNNYHWSSDGRGVDLTVNLSITSQWSAAVNGGTTDWEKSRKLSFTSQEAANDEISRKRCQPISGQIRVCNAAYGQRQWLGLATIWLSGGHISQGITQLNDSYFDMARYNTPEWRQMVACQEIAHDFGLDHQDETFSNVNLGTCMDYSSNPAGGVYNGFDYGPSNVHPNDHDFEEITSIYSHDDGAAPGAATATNFGVREVGKATPAADPAFNEAPGLSPSEWGRAVAYDAHGRPDVFVKDFGGGLKRVTHVFWTVDAKVR